MRVMNRDEATLKKNVKPANPTPCRDCPWRVENQGKRHKDGWFTKANRDRLWAKLRRGDSMTCHMTDPDNPVPEGYREVPDGVTTHECAGALILQQREFHKMQKIGDITAYRKKWPRGLTKEGLVEILNRHLYGGVPFMGYKTMPTPGLNAPVEHEHAVGKWEDNR